MLSALPRRRRARQWAKMYGGRRGLRAMNDYQLAATELGLLHERAARRMVRRADLPRGAAGTAGVHEHRPGRLPLVTAGQAAALRPWLSQVPPPAPQPGRTSRRGTRGRQLPTKRHFSAVGEWPTFTPYAAIWSQAPAVASVGEGGGGLAERVPYAQRGDDPQRADPHQGRAEHVQAHQDGGHAQEVLGVADARPAPARSPAAPAPPGGPAGRVGHVQREQQREGRARARCRRGRRAACATVSMSKSKREASTSPECGPVPVTTTPATSSTNTAAASTKPSRPDVAVGQAARRGVALARAGVQRPGGGDQADGDQEVHAHRERVEHVLHHQAAPQRLGGDAEGLQPGQPDQRRGAGGQPHRATARRRSRRPAPGRSTIRLPNSMAMLIGAISRWAAGSEAVGGAVGPGRAAQARLGDPHRRAAHRDAGVDHHGRQRPAPHRPRGRRPDGGQTGAPEGGVVCG